MQRILVIQTAFLGDVVLATSVVEKLHHHYPQAQIDFLLRTGHESLFQNHPFLGDVLIWEKSHQKTRHLFHLLQQIRQRRYDLVVNLQRFFSTGLLTAFSGARHTVGFDKNPLSLFFSEKKPHQMGLREATGQPWHEVERCQSLIFQLTDERIFLPKIYPSPADYQVVAQQRPYLTISPASVWFTKQFPENSWVELMERVGERYLILLLGGPDDLALCEKIKAASRHPQVEILAGKQTFLQSAALMQGAAMNYVNDSAPLHFASAVDALVTAFFCSTVPAFGFTPLSENSKVVETFHELPCRPCGLHGKKACPEGHFKCSEMDFQAVLQELN